MLHNSQAYQVEWMETIHYNWSKDSNHIFEIPVFWHLVFHRPEIRSKLNKTLSNKEILQNIGVGRWIQISFAVV